MDSTASESGPRLYEIVAPQCREQFARKLLESWSAGSGRGRAVMLLEAMATKGRSGEWLDEHPVAALAAIIACVLVGGWLA